MSPITKGHHDVREDQAQSGMVCLVELHRLRRACGGKDGVTAMSQNLAGQPQNGGFIINYHYRTFTGRTDSVMGCELINTNEGRLCTDDLKSG